MQGTYKIRRLIRLAILTLVMVGPVSATSATAQSAWQPVTVAAPSYASLLGISCPSFSTCVIAAATNSDHLIYTHDGGNTWVATQVSNAAGMLDVSCGDNQNCYAINSSIVYKSADGGQTWDGGHFLNSTYYGGTPHSLRKIHCPSASRCAVVGSNGATYRTTDGGLNWTYNGAGVAFQFSGVHCPDTNTCYALSLHGNLLKTTDFWTSRTTHTAYPDVSGTGGALMGIYCATPSDCIVVGGDGTSGTIIGATSRTSDGGVTWSTSTYPGVRYLMELSCFSTSDCYAVGMSQAVEGVIMESTNGGASWSTQHTSAVPEIKDIACGNSLLRDCWAVGSNATVVNHEVPDGDSDGIPDEIDNCPTAWNTDQTDSDSDGAGDACDIDDDGDGVNDIDDDFPLDPTESVDTDSDGIGNNADADDDNDGQTDVDEVACGSDPLAVGDLSPDLDGDGSPDCVDVDDDGDGIADVFDNCPTAANADQVDADGDGAGDVCDIDGFQNDDPTVDNVSVSGPETIELGTAANLVVAFSDPDPVDPHTVQWDWGDTSTSAGVVNEAVGTATGTHTYGEVGVYSVTVTVTDDHAGSTQETYDFIVVYDPAAGSVRGNGDILSPIGACTLTPACETASGDATFGFASQYRNGKNTPDGRTRFAFRAGDLTFVADKDLFEWLIVSGNKARFKGEGQINHAGRYGFMITGLDGDLSANPGDEDAFRIRIWDKNAGDGVVYDNHRGAAADADPTTTLVRGDIKIVK